MKTSLMITSEQIVDVIKAAVEPIDTIFKVLQENNGKRIDKRLIEKLRAATGDNSIRRRSEYGMTSICWNTISNGLICAYDVKNVYVDSAWIKEQNTWAFSARDERNRRRHNNLGNIEAIDNLVKATNALKEAKKAYRTALDGFEDYHRLNDLCIGID